MNKILREDIINIVNQNIKWDSLAGSTILVTGASGMIGSYIVNVFIYLNQLNHSPEETIKIHLLVRDKNKLSRTILNDPNVKVIKQSVTEPINSEISFDYIIHAASPASPKIMREDPVGTIGANTIGTWNTLNLAKHSKAKGYLFISSREIYGQPAKGQELFFENTYGTVDPLDPRSSYPEGKKAAETMCVSFKEQYKLNTKIARLAHTYGPGMPVDDGRVQADFLKNIIAKQDIVMKSQGLPVRTYTYIADAVSAIFYILLNSPAEEVVYNISTEEDKVSIRKLAETLVETFASRNLKLIIDIPAESQKTGASPYTLGILSSEKLRRLGWEPLQNIKTGFKRTVEFLESE